MNPAPRPNTAHPRLPEFSYRGTFAYHLTIVSHKRERNLLPAERVISQALDEAAAACDFELLAWVIMPDHMHMLTLGLLESSDCVRFLQRFKQLSAYRFKQRTGSRLWQPSFHDHVARTEEDLWALAKYIVENPVRARLCDAIEEWPQMGGTLLTAEWRS